MNYTDIIKQIAPINPDMTDIARARQDRLIKPPGSLGRLEEISIRLCGITGRMDYRPGPCAVLVFAGDNGIVAQGVSSAPQSVTLAQTVNMTKGITGMSAIAGHFGDRVIVTDVGVASDIDCPKVINRKIRYGTADFSQEPAMTLEETQKALDVGIETALSAIDDGANCIGIGEMGIGNTSSSACVLAALTETNVSLVTGYGGTLTKGGYAHKVGVLEEAMHFHKLDSGDVLRILSLVGGLDIAAMAGAFLGCAYRKVPVVIDGFISAVAALVATGLCKEAAEYMFMSHISAEPGYKIAVKALQEASGRDDFVPYFDLGMRLGEGSGCPLMFRIIEAATAIMCDMGTFEEGGVDDHYLDEIRNEMSP